MTTSALPSTRIPASTSADPPASSKPPPVCSWISATTNGRYAPNGSDPAEPDMTITYPPEPDYMDGNVLAGPFAELFAVDVAAAATTCVGCGRRSRVAQLHVYVSGPGSVA